jgi:Lrp/AsnC family leucine-responsive transcriptional regulator
MDDPATAVADLDAVDLQILAYVENDFDVNLEELSEEFDFSKSAIHYRLNKLREKGVITGVSADVDPLRLGLNMMVISDVSVTHETGYASEIGAKLAEVEGVQQVYYTMGDVDFVVISRVQNRDQMNHLIDELVAIDGVNETSSRFVMQEHKADTNVMANMSPEMEDAIVEFDG